MDGTGESSTEQHQNMDPGQQSLPNQPPSVGNPQGLTVDQRSSNNDNDNIQVIQKQKQPKRKKKKYPSQIGERCTVPGCGNRRGLDKASGVKRVYYGYPLTDLPCMKQWILAISRDCWYPSEHSKICSDHFRGGEAYFFFFYSLSLLELQQRHQRIKMQFSYLHFKHPNILRTSDELSRSIFFLESITP